MREKEIRHYIRKTSAKTRKNYADSLREIKIYVGQDQSALAYCGKKMVQPKPNCRTHGL